MKKFYSGIDKTSFKLVIAKESTIVDEKNNRVIHMVDWSVTGPTIFEDFCYSMIPNNNWQIKGRAKGVAVCQPEDKFDPEIGKKLARAMAESNAYHNASNILRKRMNRINKIVYDLEMMSIDFKMKADEIKTHNREYQDSLV